MSIPSNNEKSNQNAQPEELEETAKRKRKLDRSRLAAKAAEGVSPKLGKRIGNCRSWVTTDVYEHFKTHAKVRKVRETYACDVTKFCPVCAWDNAQEVSKDLRGRLAALKKAGDVYVQIFLTLTVKNCALGELRKTLVAMSVGWRRLMQTKRWKQAVTGGYFRGTEYIGDKTPKGQAHPHFHAILLMKPTYFTGKTYIKHAEWVQMWRDAMRLNYDPVVGVQRITERRRKHQDEVAAAVAEVAKYSVTPATIERLTSKEFGLLYSQTKGLRQFAYGGLLAEILPLLDPEEQFEDSEEWQSLCTEVWTWGSGQYVLTRRDNK